MYNLIFVAVACTIVCNASPATTKQGSFNKYFIYSREANRIPIEIIPGNATADLNAKLINTKTSIIVHGHGGSSTTSLNPTLKEAFLEHEDVNVIIVDWAVYASQIYRIAVAAVPSVGLELANFITVLVANETLSLENLHLIGFDLGAHVVGFTGRILNSRVARITGLNPSRNLWGPNSQRLNKNDAQYVEVIHTNSGSLFSYGIGEAIGHVDFFVNGGRRQPGCIFSNLCSHDRSWKLMAASLTSSHLVGNLCANRFQVIFNTCRGLTMRMGGNELIKFGSGMFRVNTRRRYPF